MSESEGSAIIDRIFELREQNDGFPRTATRWSEIYIIPSQAEKNGGTPVKYLGDPSDRARHKDAIHISNMTREDWEAFSVKHLVRGFETIIRRNSFQVRPRGRSR